MLLARLAEDPRPGQAPQGACSRTSPDGSGRRTTRPTAAASGNGCVGSGSGRPATSSGVVRETVVDLCGKRARFAVAYHHPGGHRTSNMLDRMMRGMNRYFDRRPTPARLAGGVSAALPGVGVAVPTSRRGTRRRRGENHGWRCPAERLNQHRYHDCWLQNLLISASLGGYRCPLAPKSVTVREIPKGQAVPQPDVLQGSPEDRR